MPLAEAIANFCTDRAVLPSDGKYHCTSTMASESGLDNGGLRNTSSRSWQCTHAQCGDGCSMVGVASRGHGRTASSTVQAMLGEDYEAMAVAAFAY